MPELPEVEFWRRLAEREAVGRTIIAVRVEPDARVMDRDAPSDFMVLNGRRVSAARRKGKHLWLELDRPPHLYLHFAMTGDLNAYASEAERPRHLKLELCLDSGRRLGFSEVRRFGKARLMKDSATEPSLARLGFDAWTELPKPAEFASRLEGRKAPIKAVLLDQSFAAGVGNWIADEVLYQAGIDPRRPADRLRPEEVRRLRTRLRSILETATRHDPFANRFPPSWLFHYRWNKRHGGEDARGRAIRHVTVGGRTTAFVPEVQR